MEVSDIVGCHRELGEIGVEIEMEASDLPPIEDVRVYWRKDIDASLRGESCEFVLKNPVSKANLPKAFQELSNALVKNNTVVRPTYRAGIHVHINVQDLTPKQLITFISLYFMFEEVLLSYCDKSRVGNHFCLRLTDASYTLDMITDAILSSDLKKLNTEDLRYASLNVTSLFKYGSIEFRALESIVDFEKIQTWALVLHKLKEFAKSVNCPTDILGQASERGFVPFARNVFGEFEVVFSPFITEEKIRQGIRNIQYAVYSRNWSSVNLNIFDKNKSLFSS